MTAHVCPHPEKKAYPSERAAKRGLRAIRHPHGRMKVYRCGMHWHLAHRDVLDKTPPPPRRRTKGKRVRKT